MLSVLVGLIVAGVSVWGMILWYSELFFVLKGFLPLCFFFGGLIAIIVGASAISSQKKPVEAISKKENEK